MHGLQELGERLAELGPDKLSRLGLPENLTTALADYKRFNKWEAKRRQMQYIGRLMREIDPAPISAQLDAWTRGTRAAVAGFHAAETWRDRLLADDGALNALMTEHPAADHTRIIELVGRARSERAAGKPPASARLLFRELSRILDANAPATGDDLDG
jgi:ribosome-associated protein